MLIIKLYKSNDELKKISIIGHAGSGTYGNDVVCAKISVLTQSFLVGLKKFSKLDFYYGIKDGFLEFDLGEEKLDLLVSVFIDFLLINIERLYNENKEYLKIENLVYKASSQQLNSFDENIEEVNFAFPKYKITILKNKKHIFAFKRDKRYFNENIISFAVDEILNSYVYGFNKLYGLNIKSNDKFIFDDINLYCKTGFEELLITLEETFKGIERQHPKNLKVIKKGRE